MSKQKTIKIDEVEYIRADSVENLQTAEKLDGMKFCIARCRDAGVHAGYVKEYHGREATLINARRLWSWYGRTLSELATNGSTDEENSKYGCPVLSIVVLDACELIECTQKGKDSIYRVPEWEPAK